MVPRNLTLQQTSSIAWHGHIDALLPVHVDPVSCLYLIRRIRAIRAATTSGVSTWNMLRTSIGAWHDTDYIGKRGELRSRTCRRQAPSWREGSTPQLGAPRLDEWRSYRHNRRSMPVRASVVLDRGNEAVLHDGRLDEHEGAVERHPSFTD